MLEAAVEAPRKLNIALIEDDPFDYRLIGGLLKRIKGIDCDVVWVKSFDEANNLLQEREFDLALVDYSIGIHSGIDVVRAHGGRDAVTPMVMLTGAGSLEIDMEAMEAGAYDFLDKGEMSVGQLDRSIRYTLRSRRMEDDLKKAREDAELASKAKSNFLSHLSHDLKTPLNAIVGFAELILSDMCKSEDIKSYISQIYSSGRHLTEMIEDLLTLTYFDLQKAKCEPESRDVTPAFDEVIELTNFAAMERGVEVLAADNYDGGAVTADAKALVRILVNIITVAVKHSDANGIVTLASSQNPESSELSICWGGTPISSEVVKEVLNDNPYSSDAYTTSSNGVGLSLSIARQYMLMHGGKMRIEKQLSGGMCVKLEFPVDARAREALGLARAVSPLN